MKRGMVDLSAPLGRRLVDERRRNPLLLALLFSAGLHALALFAVEIPEGQATPRDEPPIEVALLRPESAKEKEAFPEAPPEPRQMVAPPDTVNDQTPERTRFESDRDNTVLQETVRPGVPNPGPGGAAEKRPPAAPRPPAKRADAARAEAAHEEEAAESHESHGPALHDLFASTDELVQAERAGQERKAREKATDGKGQRRQRVALAVPPVAPEWSLPGTRGTFDYLPNIQRGNVTLLNTKASVFAPFVRRVGERVFQHLVIRQRQLEIGQILGAKSPVEMRVVLDPSGKLKSISVGGHSGSASMDDTLSDALNTAAFDNNPPTAAANAEGNYEFVFQAQLRTFAPGQGGLPSRIESRLSVGLL